MGSILLLDPSPRDDWACRSNAGRGTMKGLALRRCFPHWTLAYIIAGAMGLSAAAVGAGSALSSSTTQRPPALPGLGLRRTSAHAPARPHTPRAHGGTSGHAHTRAHTG